MDTMLVESKRINMQTVEISLSFESFLCRLLGDTMLYIHDKKSEGKWKKVLKRITSAIEKSINKNIVTDEFHQSRFQLYIDKLKDACKSKNIIDIDVIHALTGIIFELIGGLPDYNRRHVLNRNDNYILKMFRTIYYSQSPYQKMRTILEASRFEPFCKYHRYDELFSTYVHNYNGNSEGFIQWYKEKYPEVYLKLF
jgi:hypothetical protein